MLTATVNDLLLENHWKANKIHNVQKNNYKIGLNIIMNRFNAISNIIELNLFNLSYPAYKHEMKNIFLPLI